MACEDSGQASRPWAGVVSLSFTGVHRFPAVFPSHLRFWEISWVFLTENIIRVSSLSTLIEGTL